MTKYSGTTRRPLQPNVIAPARTTGQPLRTFEEGDALAREPKSDLFLLAATNMAGEDTFYERAGQRDGRFVSLIHQVTAEDPTFIAGADLAAGRVGLAQYLRQQMLMRSASVVLAAEYVAAGGPQGRSVVSRALQRPDEPAELLGYWMSTHGRRLPMPIKRGVADAARRLYDQRAVLRYDGLNRQIRMADVIELTHPVPKDEAQSALFAYLLNRRHRGETTVDASFLPVLAAALALEAVPAGERRQVLRDRGPAALAAAGFSWERLAGWIPGGMDAEAWESIIPNMGAMALARNLRNFDQATISPAAVEVVVAKLTDPVQVSRARLFPYQVWSAYRRAPSDNWKWALGTTLELTTANITPLDGTLVVVDVSGSMQARLSNHSAMSRVEVAAVMAMSTARSGKNVDVVIFGTDNAMLRRRSGESVLAAVSRLIGSIGSVGHGTNGHTAVRRHFNPRRHRRVVIFTDDQMRDSGAVRLDHVPLIYTFNLAGYRPSALTAGQRGRYTLGGFTDATFSALAALDGGNDTLWPF